MFSSSYNISTHAFDIDSCITLAMNLIGSDPFSRRSLSSLEDDIMIKKLLLSHDPDGCRLIDSELLLRATENIMLYTTTSVEDQQFHDTAKNDISNIAVLGSEEPLGQTIYKISGEILCSRFDEGGHHMTTMFLFDLLGKYKWDEKVVLVIAAFAATYGEFCLLMQLYPHNPLAISIAILKQLPSDLSMLKPRMKALSLLVKTMMDVTKCIIKFEGLPISQVELDKEVAVTKSYVYVAAYWVTRSALTCSCQITNLIALKPDQVHPDSTKIATLELLSLVHRLTSICSGLRKLVDVCHEQTEKKMYQKLLNILKEESMDNQEVVNMLFALKDDLPLKDCSSQAKYGLTKLKDKVVVLLITKPQLLPIEELLLLVQQTYDHPLNKEFKENYEIVWFPIPNSDKWTDVEVISCSLLSNSLPWYSIRQPWLLSSVVVNCIKQAWNYKGDPQMVVLDSKGMVKNPNAIDMVMSWGARAYPFSDTRENQLWEEEKKWTLQLMIDEIDPLLSHWVEECRIICIYGSENQEWIREFNSKMKKKIKTAGVQLEMVYVGMRNTNENVENILAAIAEEKLGVSLSHTKMRLFWLRLESLRRSKLRLGMTPDTDNILKEVSALLDFNDKGWALMGKGSSPDIVKFENEELMKRLDLFPEWGENVEKLGFLGAFEGRSLPAGPCDHSNVIPYADGLIEGTVICEKCKRQMKKSVVYQ